MINEYSTKEEVLKEVAKVGCSLIYASDELKNDKEVVIAAVKENRYALTFASDELIEDKDFKMLVKMTNEEEIEILFAKYLGVGIDYNSLKIYDKKNNNGVDIESWVKAYDDVDINCPSGLWCMENKILPYDIKKINNISFFEFRRCLYRNGSKNSRIKRLLSHCNEKSRETADVYIIEKSDKIYIEIDKY